MVTCVWDSATCGWDLTGAPLSWVLLGGGAARPGLRKRLNFLKGQTNAGEAAAEDERAPGSTAVKVIYQGAEIRLTAAQPRRTCLGEITEATEMKVNHSRTFYTYNPALQLPSCTAVKAPSA